MMVVVVVVLTHKEAGMVVMMVMMNLGNADHDLGELERFASLFLQRLKRVHGVRDGIQQFSVGGCGRQVARAPCRGRRGQGAAAAK